MESVIVLPLVLSPAVMAAATLVERRVGPAGAGWFAALPLAFAVAVVTVTVDAGSAAAQTMALSAAAHVPAQLCLALVAGRLLLRHGLTVGLLSGVAAYAVTSVALGALPIVVALGLAVVLVAVTPRWMPTVPADLSPRLRSRTSTALTCLAAPVIVGAAVLATRLSGPELAGTIAALPTMSLTVTVAVSLGGQRDAGARALIGLVRSLPCYLVFCLVGAVVLPLTGASATLVALLAALVAAGVIWRFGAGTLRPATS